MEKKYEIGVMAVEKWVNDCKNIYNPYNLTINVSIEGDTLILDNYNWQFDLPLDSEDFKYDFNFSINNGCVNWYDIDQIVDIRDNAEEIVDIFKNAMED